MGVFRTEVGFNIVSRMIAFRVLPVMIAGAAAVALILVATGLSGASATPSPSPERQIASANPSPSPSGPRAMVRSGQVVDTAEVMRQVGRDDLGPSSPTADQTPRFTF